MSSFDFTRDELIELLRTDDPHIVKVLRERAYRTKLDEAGPVVYTRGLIEISNACIKNCLYCGIRRDRTIVRYTLTRSEIVDCARLADSRGLASIVLQAGERQDPRWVQFIEEALHDLHAATGHRLHVTLSLGEQSCDTYRRWKLAGAHRYLLRIETSNRTLYEQWHPADHSFDTRLQCLRDLRDLGYQVGTGVLIGAPGQTLEDLADDLLFFRDLDVDMIGMGPYVLHRDTPMGELPVESDEHRAALMLRMIALARLMLRDVNIAATTALSTLRRDGREQGLLHGANVVMPNITPMTHRADYDLYEGKKMCEGDHALQCIAMKAAAIGESVGWNEWGDPKHALRRAAGS
jgi:biotin synthase